MKRTSVALIVFTLCIGLHRHAQGADFKTHYDLAMALYQAQKFEEAIPEFKAAYEREAKPGLLFNIAQSYRKAGHLREAIEYYDRYLSSEPKLDNDMRKKVDGYLAEARNTLAALELEMKQRLAEEKAAREREPAPPSAAPPSAAQPSATPPTSGESGSSVSAPVARAEAPLTAASPKDPAKQPSPIYKRWWFWTAIGGAVAAAAIITGVAVGTRPRGYPDVPAGVPRAVIAF